MIVITIFITIFTIIIVITILLIFLGVEYQLGDRSVFFSSSRCYFVRATNSIKFQSLNTKKSFKISTNLNLKESLISVTVLKESVFVFSGNSSSV